MNHRKKKIVATCMVVYMGTLALPQTPAHAHESDQTAVIQPAGEHASIHTDLEIPTTTEEPALVQPSLDEAGTPQTEPNTTVTPEGSLEEENAGGNDPQPAGDPDSEEEELELTEPTMQPDGIKITPVMGMMSALAAQPVVDPSQDLVITVKSTSVATPTINEVYDTEIGEDEYLPGKDASPYNQISTGRSVVYDVAFSFASKSYSEENYVINDVQIVAVDENGNEISFQTPIYMNNGVETEQFADIKEIKWDDNAGLVTGGTAQMSMAVELPAAVYWDTKIEPRIKLKGTVQGTPVESEVITLPAVKLSSQAIMGYSFTNGDHQEIRYIADAEAFQASANFTAWVRDQDHLIGLLDLPQFKTQTYYFKVNALLDSRNVASQLEAENFSVVPGSGMALVDGEKAIRYDKDTQMLAITMQPTNGTAPLKVDSQIYIQVPSQPCRLLRL